MGCNREFFLLYQVLNWSLVGFNFLPPFPPAFVGSQKIKKLGCWKDTFLENWVDDHLQNISVSLNISFFSFLYSCYWNFIYWYFIPDPFRFSVIYPKIIVWQYIWFWSHTCWCLFVGSFVFGRILVRFELLYGFLSFPSFI